MTDTSAGTQVPQNFPPITLEDLAKLGIESQLLPFIISTTSRTEESSNGSPPLNSVEAETLIEILDKVVSSPTVTPSLKNSCFPILRKSSSAHGILPRSYYPPGMRLSDTIPYSSGGFADIWKGQRDGNQLCVKTIRTQTASNLDNIKRRFYREIVGWKYVSHPNVQPFLGVSESLFSFSIISPWLPNGNIAEYIQKNPGVNRLQLLAQAACGLEYLHSLSIVHSDINPGNILITDDGNARLGDFGITGIIADPTVVEPGSTTTSKPGVVRYMAPELLNPSQFSLANSNPSKESDVYSFAMTAYEILTDTLPYGDTRDGIIIFHVVTGNRPPRPADTPWLEDHIWDVIQACWSEKREQRWDMHSVYNQFSTPNMQEVLDVQIDVQVIPTLNAIIAPPPGDLFITSLPVKSEELNPPVRREARTELLEREKELFSQAAPIPNTANGETPEKDLGLPGLPGSGNTRELSPDPGVQGKRTRKSSILSRGLSRIRRAVDVLKGFVRSKKSPRTEGHPPG